MPRLTIGTRWVTPSRRYTGGWRQNPWINAVSAASRARSESNQDLQQKAAVKIWENEGGSLSPHPGVSR